MKILLANKFLHLRGGCEKVFLQERRLLQKEGHYVIDFSMTHENNKPSSFCEYFVRKISYHEKTSLFNKAIKAISFIHSHEASYKFAKLVSIFKPDIAHFHNIYHQITPSIISIAKNNTVSFFNSVD